MRELYFSSYIMYAVSMKKVLLVFLLTFGCLRSEAQLFESAITIGLISTALYAGLGHITCQFRECCMPQSSWITPNITAIKNELKSRVHGQHLVQDVVVRAILSHYSDPEPKKALVISFHGDTGTGKNFVSDILSTGLYKKGIRSRYIHKYIASVDFRHESQTDLYKLELIDNIRAQVAICDRSLFIFDEVQQLQPGIIDVIKPFIDYHQNIKGVDYRKSVFIFLSNTGTKDILRFMLDWWSQGKTRADITLPDIEHLVQSGAFNEKGGLHMSELIQHSLVDYYVPFLPMERRHIELCARDDLISRGKREDENIIRNVADEMTYFPSANPLFASKGCKNVHQKVGYQLTNFDRF
uniref:Torsin-1A-like n=2 Tax=Hirondellea gigas TaxID=1518452 RepID=A0A2P2I884_9CRUS